MSGVTSSIRIGPKMVRSASADFAVRHCRTSWRLLSRSLIHSTGGVRNTFSPVSVVLATGLVSNRVSEPGRSRASARAQATGPDRRVGPGTG